ncbi:unnamed protein product, partial [Cyprideis torosa]
SVALVKFSNQPAADSFLIVGVANEYQLNPRQVNGGFLYAFKVTNKGTDLVLLHKTPVEEVPGAMAPLQGKLLVSVGRLLRVYEMGKKKMLRKCESKSIPNYITSIQTMGSRVFATDIQFRPLQNQLVLFADDTIPRWVTCSTLLDFDTVALADKFGNVAVIRLPTGTNDDTEEDPTGNKALWDRGYLNGASQKAEQVFCFHVGETVLSLQKATLIPGGNESLVYTTLSGTIGVFVPFTSRDDFDFFQHLEMHMRNEHPPICGRDHLSFRSYYFPVKNVIDGDLCEQFNSLDLSKQKSIAEDMDKAPNEVSKKLEDVRTRYAF